MNDNSKNKFTFRIIFSYLTLGLLALGSGSFIYIEIKTYLSSETAEENDEKLLKTNSFLTELYEAESLSKQSIQTKTNTDFKTYSQKIDAIHIAIDTLKHLTDSQNQKNLLDSVQILLTQKVSNYNALLKLKVKNDANSSIDNAIKEFAEMEVSLGKITAEALAPQINDLDQKSQQVIRDVAKYLNDNVPINTDKITNSKQIDSIISASKLLLAKAKQTDFKAQQYQDQKEAQINQNDQDLSQQLRTIISAFEQEVLVNSFNDNIKKKSALNRSIRLAGFAALLGVLVVSIFAFLINRDFWRTQTYRKKLEKEKKYSESLLKSREQLISTVSHDLRTPLNTITGYTELMEGTELTQKQDRYLSNVKSASEYVENLVNDLLDFSKLAGGKLNIENIPFNVAILIQETAESLQAIHKDKKLQLYLEIDNRLQNTVLGDPFRLRQILTNLIGNAFKFTKEGHVKVSATAVTKEKSTVTKIKISDTGIGIAKEKQFLIFNEFTQADTATEKKFGGYGLGLTISKKLTELLKGTLTLESKLNQGSAFTLQIPLQGLKNSDVKKSDTSYLLPKLRLLIIDDDIALLSMLRELTESIGMIAHTHTNFLQVERDSHLGYDLVLTDIQMPQITGFEVLEKLQSGDFNHYKKQPIIAMTGRRDIDAEAYTEIGFDEVLQKPFSKNELIGVLKRIGFEANEFSTTIQNEQPQNRETKTTYKNYSLEIIHSFLGTNTAAVNEVLQTFLRNTNTNMHLLEDGVSFLDFSQINEVAHRMLPMFRQLKVMEVVLALERLEVCEPTTIKKGQLMDTFQLLKTKIKTLTSEINEDLTIRSNYSD